MLPLQGLLTLHVPLEQLVVQPHPPVDTLALAGDGASASASASTRAGVSRVEPARALSADELGAAAIAAEAVSATESARVTSCEAAAQRGLAGAAAVRAENTDGERAPPAPSGSAPT